MFHSLAKPPVLIQPQHTKQIIFGENFKTGQYLLNQSFKDDIAINGNNSYILFRDIYIFCLFL